MFSEDQSVVEVMVMMLMLVMVRMGMMVVWGDGDDGDRSIFSVQITHHLPSATPAWCHLTEHVHKHPGSLARSGQNPHLAAIALFLAAEYSLKAQQPTVCVILMDAHIVSGAW